MSNHIEIMILLRLDEALDVDEISQFIPQKNGKFKIENLEFDSIEDLTKFLENLRKKINPEIEKIKLKINKTVRRI